MLAVIALVYWPGMGGGFAFDDYPNIVFNRSLHVSTLEWGDLVAAMFSSRSSELQRPFAMLTFAIQHYFTGLDPWPMKLANLGIHMVNTLLVFGLVRSLLRTLQAPSQRFAHGTALPWIVSVAWAVMPINVLAVLFIVQRMELLCHTFVFSGLWLYVVGRQRLLQARPGWGLILAGLILAPTLGLLSKESAVLLPLYAFALEMFLFRFADRQGRYDRRLLLLFSLALFLPAVLGGSWLLHRALAPGAFASRDFSLVERLLTEPRVVFDYLQWSLLPDLKKLGLYHDDYAVSRSLLDPPATLFGLAGIGALLFAAICFRNWRPLTSLGISWFLGAQLLTATFLPLELVFEHRNYFASLGLCLILADILLLLPQGRSRKSIGWVAIATLTSFYAGSTYLRATEWSSPVRFAVSEAAKHPLSPRATYQLGHTYVILSKAEPGSPLTQAAFSALERARQVPRSGILPAQGLLILAARSNAPLKNAWWNDIETGLRNHALGPQELGAIAALNDCQIERQCNFPDERVERMFRAAMSHGPHPETLNIYGNHVLNVHGDLDTAELMWRQARQLSPRNPQYRINLIGLLIVRGKFEAATTEIRLLRRMSLAGATRLEADRLQQQNDSAKRQATEPTSQSATQDGD